MEPLWGRRREESAEGGGKAKGGVKCQPHKACLGGATNWIVSFQNSYAQALSLHVTVFGDGASGGNQVRGADPVGRWIAL